MTNQTIKVGVLPGGVTEYLVEAGTTVAKVLEMAGLDASGYDVRLDGVSVAVDSVIGADSKLIVLVKQIKGNVQTIKVGVLPGGVTEYVVDGTLTVQELLDMAELDATGYDIRLDGTTVTADTRITADSKLIVLVKQIKGNVSTIKVGILPGGVSEFTYEGTQTVGAILELASIDPTGYDVRLDGNSVTTDTVIGADSKLIVLVKQIKGNN